MNTRISAPAHPSATGFGRVSGLVSILLGRFEKVGEQLGLREAGVEIDAG